MIIEMNRIGEISFAQKSSTFSERNVNREFRVSGTFTHVHTPNQFRC